MPLTKYRHLLNSLIDGAPDAMVVVDNDGKIALVNQQVEHLFGYNRDEVLSLAVEVLIPEGLRESHVMQRQEYMRQPVPRPMGNDRTLHGKRKDGGTFPVDIMLSPVQDGDLRMVVATIRDATVSRAAEHRIQTSEAMFRALYDQAPDAILGVDYSGMIVQVNRAVESMFGYRGAELLNQPIEILLPERYRLSHVSQRNDYLKNPETRPMGRGLELFGRRKDGTEIPVDIMLSPVLVPGKNLILTVIRDITDRKLAEKQIKERAEQLKRSNQELEQFAYVASHDLQEPLRAIAASCQILQRRLAGKFDADTNEYIDFAIDGAKRMQELINDLLSYSRVSKGDRRTDEVDLNRVMERVRANLAQQIQESGAEIHCDCLSTVKADFSQLVQLFQNLMTNAMKFRAKDRKPIIHVSCKDLGNEWLFTVADNGIGIAPEYRERIFIVFQRLHRREEYPGTGIGLAICKKIVERHQGRIWLESEVGQGTTFLFTLAKGEPS